MGRWLQEWCEDDPESAQLDDAWYVELPYERWEAAGQAPGTSASAEEIDLFQSRHSALAQLLGVSSQRISIESIGHVGAPDLGLVLVVDGERLPDPLAPTPFARDGAGVLRPLTPCAYAVYLRLCRWNDRGETSRPEQIVFVSELRELLERATAALATAAVPFSFELDEHLSAFRAHRPARLSLGWEARRDGAVFDLQLQETGDDGQPRPLDLDKLDPQSGLLELSATEHVLLDAEAEQVARVAKGQRNKLRRHVEQYFSSPSALLPEGLSLEAIDLSAYSPRVVGFSPIVKVERDFDIQSSGVEWYQSDGESPFLRLLIAQPGGGGVALVQLETPEDAERAAAELESAIERRDPRALEIGGRRVEPNAPLLRRLRQDLEAFRARGGAPPVMGAAPPSEPSNDEAAKSGRLAAEIEEDVVPMGPATDDAPSSPVPWGQLEVLLAPGVQLKPHQREAIRWLWDRYQRGEHGVLLADDMGLGKTLQIAAFLALVRATSKLGEPRRPHLIVCPVILLDNWDDELRTFFRPEVFAARIVLYGDELRRRKRERSLDLSGLAQSDTVLTNYETLQSHQQSLLTLDWEVVALDEAQAIKNPDTYRARAARGLKRRFGICSTGTPVENKLSDLWALYDFLRPGDPFSTLKEFQRTYEADPVEGVPRVREVLRYPGASASLLRRTKNEVLALPAKTVEVHRVPMTPQQVELERHLTSGPRSQNVLQVLQGLQKLYQHPQLLVSETERRSSWSVATALAESPKLALCVQILRTIRAAGEKALVFTLWMGMQELLVDVLRAELGLPRVRVINGDPSQRRHAKKYIDELGQTSGFGVLILSPLAAGTGLTITSANHVIHYGRWWNPAKEDQATDRAYRIGQTRPVRVHYPLLHHPGQQERGFDVKLHGLVEGKRGMARDFLAPREEDEVTMQDLEDMKEGGS